MKTGLKKLDWYVDRVDKGKEIVCKWVKLAVERHYDDLKNQKTKKFPYYFNLARAEWFFEWTENNLSHFEGVMAGRPLVLDPWQYFIYGSIFGWYNTEKVLSDGKEYDVRRFRNAIIIVPKKMGKSIMSGAVGLYMARADGWPGAQCYTLAKNQTHAKDLGYRSAMVMVENSPTLNEDFKVNRSAAGVGIYCHKNNSFYKPITSKPDSEDGRHVQFCGPDETKDWTDFEIYNLMKNGTVNNYNSLFMSTTTAGDDLLSLGYSQQKYLENVLKGRHVDETTFGVIYTVDEEDKKGDDWWCDPKLWRKANPGLGKSVFEKAMQDMVHEAKESPGKKISFQTKHLNIWHTSSEEFVTESMWARCGKKKGRPVMKYWKEILEEYKGVPCWGGLDLGSVSDFSAFDLEFENGDVLCFFWIPEDTIPDRKGKDMIKAWVDQGWIATTPGDWTDYDYIEEQIKEVAKIVNLVEIAFDVYRMNQTVTHLIDEGIEMIEFRQGDISMSPAIDTLENSIKKGKIEHFNNPVLAWMCGNVAIKKGPTGLRKFDKNQAQDKIDGLTSLAMCHQRANTASSQVSGWDEFKMI